LSIAYVDVLLNSCPPKQLLIVPQIPKHWNKVPSTGKYSMMHQKVSVGVTCFFPLPLDHIWPQFSRGCRHTKSPRHDCSTSSPPIYEDSISVRRRSMLWSGTEIAGMNWLSILQQRNWEPMVLTTYLLASD